MNAAKSILAPAKINLYLHITGRRDDGLHQLDSLIMFADIADRIEIRPSEQFSFSIEGAYGSFFQKPELDHSKNSKNIIVKAARELAYLTQNSLDFSIRLTKNLPLAAGIGGGSSDAAATIRLLLAWWNITPQEIPGFDSFLVSLGADVPACMACQPVRMSGIGEILSPIDDSKEIHALLVNPGKPCPTGTVFSRFQGGFGSPASVPFSSDIEYIKKQRNDLTSAAIKTVPEITDILGIISAQKGCLLSRMSGSGATCFGLFGDKIQTHIAAKQIARQQPHWWVRSCILNKVV
ncbi:MAG: 4-(cytidine 5'-diphospho)-2-C-methyl-D-erythritol kinase [Alphaproteobacteria bacterium CG_4_9_14_3_um_filter_47_13]|nr:MAG: 4-(cytidine 5'-diphospho)-2-C-methyl-D-erythritol kinase [Alphaproteobacteria bacterium CG_4_9_14_3_um_filter_47_13]